MVMASFRLRSCALRPRCLLLALIVLPALASAQGLPGITNMPGPGGSQTWSLSVQTLVLLTSLSFLPALLLSMTSFTRILIVLGLLRTAIGAQSSPPNQILVGLSLFLTFFVMSPVFDMSRPAVASQSRTSSAVY